MADPTCSDEMRKLVEALAECPPCCDNAQECNKTWVHNEARAALLSAISRYEQIVSWVRIQHTTDGLPHHRYGECVFCTLLNEEVGARLSVEEPSNG